MTSIKISAERVYSVDLVSSWREALSEEISNRESVILIPKALRSLVPSGVRNVIVVRNGESQKDFKTLEKVLTKISELGISRRGLIIGIGGGATTDLAGFSAACYLRGIDWIAVPTTVAGMVDAAIGGKTGINLSKGKNLVGSFHSPRKVIVDTKFLNSLPQRDINAGLAESIKAGFIGDKRILELVEKNPTKNLTEIIERSIRVKAKVVSRDFKESDEREILNYGHTLGHAIEKHSNYKLRHGEAVSIGLGFAAKLSNQISGLSDELTRRHFDILNSLNLPATYEISAWPKLYEFMGRDKKRKDGMIRFVTLKDIGKSDRISAPESTLSALYREISR
jgi:3-dehydroquinate synthase